MNDTTSTDPVQNIVPKPGDSVAAEKWLRDRGYEDNPVLGLTKDFGGTTIFFGTFPWNTLRVCLRFEGVTATILTNAASIEDIEALERLLGNADVDDDYEMDVDFEDGDDA